MLFMSTLIMGTMISISANSWMGMWIGLEINLLSMIPLMTNSKNMYSSESSMKYFITQTLASTILLFSMIIITQFKIDMNIPSMILNSSLLTKMGAAPFHFWFPEVMEGMNWMNCMIMLTWQKIAPMVLLMYNINIQLFSIIIIMSMMISGIMGLNQISLRKILAFSSINHIGWMIASILFMETTWMYYFMIYTIISMNIIFMFMKMNIFYLKQLFSSMNKDFMVKIFFIMNFLSLGGLPPFLGFFPKWLVIQNLTNNHLYMLTLIMVIMTLMTLYFYMRITFSTILMNSNELSFIKSKTLNNHKILTLNFISLTGLIFVTMTFNAF
uniref:NADH-ubiquinone oxidoreductase chain 2 n=1 Tax=Helophorus sp. BMNH 724835 TaxID=1903801 RepID=A0A343A3T6_9COLE|nr:NADH dehydrogenase subunit 2 [Helophorus sp. BMNH 724835]